MGVELADMHWLGPLVLETGIDKELGSRVITTALIRNCTEGHPRYYYGIDRNPKAGYLLAGEYKKLWRNLVRGLNWEPERT